MFLAAVFTLHAQTNSANFVRINGGTFTMGSPDDEPQRKNNEGPQRRVTISAFYMGKYPVTQKEWFEVTEKTVRQQQKIAGGSTLNGEGDNHPMYYVSWYDAVEYCNLLSLREGLTPAYMIDKDNNDPNNKSGVNDNIRWTVTWNRDADGYRLPTEAEWEYACRAGTTTPFYRGNNITTGQANYNGNSPYNNNAKGDYRNRTTPVGNFAPNTWGLYDMHGNVWEWCWDWFGNYPKDAQADPAGASSGTDRVLRGGGYNFSAAHARSAYRNNFTPSNRYFYIGFRLVRPLINEELEAGN